MTGENQILDVVASIYNAALDDTLWVEVLGTIEALMHGSNMHLLVTDPETQLPTFGIVSRYPEANNEYIKRYALIDERWPRILRLPHAAPAPLQRLMHSHERKTSPTYNEFLAKYDGQSQSIARMDGLNRASVILAAIREKRRGPFDGEEIEIFRRLLPHILRAVQIRQTLVSAELVNRPLMNFLDSASLGTILLDRGGRILESNTVAASILSRRDGLIADSGYVKASQRADNAALQRAIGDALAQGLGAGAGAGGMLTVSRPSQFRPWLLLVAPICTERPDFGARRAAAALLIRDPEAPSTPASVVLREIYGLTEAEARLAAALVGGASLKDYADEAAITLNTARWTLKRVFAKTETKSQADLVRLLLNGTLAAVLPTDAQMP